MMEIYRTPHDHEGLQPNLDYTGLEPVPTYGHPQYLPQDAAYAQQQQQQQQQQLLQTYGSPQPFYKICGLRRSTFWLVLVLVLLLIFAIVGGTIGGVFGSQKASNRYGNGQSSPPLPPEQGNI
jgi:hypothetical protein